METLPFVSLFPSARMLRERAAGRSLCSVGFLLVLFGDHRAGEAILSVQFRPDPALLRVSMERTELLVQRFAPICPCLFIPLVAHPFSL
jgi:hypothetical protein